MEVHHQLKLIADPPRYWRDETSGILAEAVQCYLTDHALTPNQIRYMRAYCVQWVSSSAWTANPHARGETDELKALRESAREIRSIQQLDKWLHDAVDIGMDPL